MPNNRRLYTDNFFESQVNGSLRSAEIVVPALLSLLRQLRVESVIDIGCGTGAWLTVFQAHGIREVLGIDGDYVSPALLKVDPSNFVVGDVGSALKFERRWDLAISLEVGEHLENSQSASLVHNLCNASDIVLFSACPPTPRHGTGHINERPQGFWADIFNSRGYEPCLTLREIIWTNPEVEWFYRQNMVIYAKTGLLAENNLSRATINELNVYHPDFVDILIRESLNMHTWRQLIVVLCRRLANRFGRPLRRSRQHFEVKTF